MMFWVILVVSILVILYWMFPLITVKGNSMLPAYTDHSILLGKRILLPKKYAVTVNEVYVFRNPMPDRKAKYVMKRVAGLNEYAQTVYLLGDNMAESCDSRYYGYIPKKLVVAHVIKTLYKKGV